MSEQREFLCEACSRTFVSTPEDVEAAGGHLCLAADCGLTQHEALEKLRDGGGA